VKWLRIVTALVLTVFWLPVSVHCQLEQLPGLEFLSCCDHEETTAPHQDDDCEGDACAVVESGLYKTEERHLSLPAPDLLSTVFRHLDLAEEFCFAVDQTSASETVPAELSRTWQFLSRAALPPRAPSFVS
jgi:hypothetical protein